MRFSTISLTLFACATAIMGLPIPELQPAEVVETNAQRFARGLGPATPARLYQADRVQDLKPRHTAHTAWHEPHPRDVQN